MPTHEQIVEHYQLEKKLADRLRSASKKERLHLYSEVYNELLNEDFLAFNAGI